MIVMSEGQCLAKLKRLGVAHLSVEEIYRASVYSANGGSLIAEAEKLDSHRRLLLEVRLNLSSRRLERAAELLYSLESYEDLEEVLRGDVYFLKGMVAFRRGANEDYVFQMTSARDTYTKAGDDYRALRAAINVEIVKRDATSMIAGPLRALHQESVRLGAYDLAGNICKSEAIESLKAGDLKRSIAHARKAIEYYEISGCSEDLSLAFVIGAISLLLTGERELAQEFFSSAGIRHGKVLEYANAFEAILVGRVPKFADSHQLSLVPWKSLLKKDNSVPQKIVRALKNGALTKYEIIEQVWGPTAEGPAYEARFFNALQRLRKSNEVVTYDGERYRVG